MKVKKSIIALLPALFSAVAALAQNADPSINILMDPAIVQVNHDGMLRVDATNTAGDPIVMSSLEITVSAGNNSEITGLAAGSSSSWTITAQGTGSGNTVKLQNTGGGLGGYSTDNILLTVMANTVGPASTITGNIVYIAAVNSITGQPNATQGNTQTGNDNSTTSLTVSQGNPLPIDLSSFTGVMNNCLASLSWVVNATKSYASFTLEQSTDGRSFDPAAVIDAVAGKQAYSYGLQQQAARSFYRLKLTDRSGGASYSSTLSLAADCMHGEPDLSPNPTRGSIRLSGLISGGGVRVYDQLGVVVLQRSNAPDLIDLSALPTGVYRVSWDTETGVVTHSVTRL